MLPPPERDPPEEPREAPPDDPRDGEELILGVDRVPVPLEDRPEDERVLGDVTKR